MAPLFFFFFLLFFVRSSASAARPPAAAPLSDAVITEVSQSLRRALLLDSGSGSFFTSSLLLPHLRPLTRSPSTFLVPSDAAFAGGAFSSSPLQLLSAMSTAQLRSIARFHMLTSNLSFPSLLLLPDGALLPTLLGQDYRLRVSSSSGGAASVGDVLIGGARIIRPDICPLSISHLVTCHGIDRILSLTTTRSIGDVNPAASSSSSSFDNSTDGTAISAPPPPPPHRRRLAPPPPPPPPPSEYRSPAPSSPLIAYPIVSDSNKYSGSPLVPYSPPANNTTPPHHSSAASGSNNAPSPASGNASSMTSSSSFSLPSEADSNVGQSPGPAPLIAHSGAEPESLSLLHGHRLFGVAFFVLIQHHLLR